MVGDKQKITLSDFAIQQDLIKFFLVRKHSKSTGTKYFIPPKTTFRKRHFLRVTEMTSKKLLEFQFGLDNKALCVWHHAEGYLSAAVRKRACSTALRNSVSDLPHYNASKLVSKTPSGALLDFT